MGVQVYDRKQGVVYDEPQYGEKRLHLLYETAFGRLLLGAIFARPWYSGLNAILDKRPSSVRKIQPLVERFGIDMSEYPEQSYTSYDSFVTRKIDPAKRPIADNPNALIAVADSRLLAYSVTGDGRIPVKQSSYTTTELLRDPGLASAYSEGICLVFRLGTEDYHRYCFADDGEVIRTKSINGVLHSVQPISSKRYKPFSENYREYSVIETVNFGAVVVVEVGALLVGKINNHDVTHCLRGQEKGYFSLGGSAIVILLKPGTAEIDSDIMEYSRKQIETKVRLGEKVGEKVSGP
ncbi:MAG TPA: phosphatidylserine decarboxylase [Streptosporangiaceae bacterium]|nr:phosphatidylserine decarboxylase [Streptosporangiaceae bacterium]